MYNLNMATKYSKKDTTTSSKKTTVAEEKTAALKNIKNPKKSKTGELKEYETLEPAATNTTPSVTQDVIQDVIQDVTQDVTQDITQDITQDQINLIETIGNLWDHEINKLQNLGPYYQNISGYVHYINDLNLQFSMNECKDLSSKDEMTILKSRDLNNSLQKNLVKQLTKNEYDIESVKPFNVRR